MYINKTGCQIEKNQFYTNGLSGIEIADESINKSEDDKIVNIVQCLICNNNQNGISISNYPISNLNIINCSIEGNREFGIYIKSQSNQSETQNTIEINKSMPPSLPFESNIHIVEGEITFNKKGGIYINNQHVVIDSVVIKENKEYAICVPFKSGARDLMITGLGTKLITGTIGGRWGKIQWYSKSSICICRCKIF